MEIMSKSKKVSGISITEEYTELKGQLLSNSQQLVDKSNELDTVLKTVFKVADQQDELESIKGEWVLSSNKIDEIDDSVDTLKNQKNDIIKKIEALINKKGKSTSAQSKELSKLKDEWAEASSQIAVLSSQQEVNHKERAKLIKKIETYFSKQDFKKETKETKKKEAVKKEVTKKEAVKKEPVKKTTKKEVVEVKKAPIKKVADKKSKKKEEKEASKEEEVDESTVSQMKLKLDSDSDSESSESDTDSDVSSVQSDSGSESSSSDEED
tara:strand:- start:264 stop:1067 length:804 start_codon:yes stop_codon:yes gene_type:complete